MGIGQILVGVIFLTLAIGEASVAFLHASLQAGKRRVRPAAMKGGASTETGLPQ